MQHNRKLEFFHLNEDNIVKVILIKSESLSIIEAKLIVYRKFKHFINNRKVLLQHVLEDFDEVAKMSTYERLSSFCVFVESVINTFTVDLYMTINESIFDKLLTPEKLREQCYEVFIRANYKAVGQEMRYRY